MVFSIPPAWSFTRTFFWGEKRVIYYSCWCLSTLMITGFILAGLNGATLLSSFHLCYYFSPRLLRQIRILKRNGMENGWMDLTYFVLHFSHMEKRLVFGWRGMIIMSTTCCWLAGGSLCQRVLHSLFGRDIYDDDDCDGPAALSLYHVSLSDWTGRDGTVTGDARTSPPPQSGVAVW